MSYLDNVANEVLNKLRGQLPRHDWECGLQLTVVGEHSME